MRADRRLAAAARRMRGFTLLEVVVALAIAALALVGLFRAGSSGLFAADMAAHADEALERAQSHLAGFARAAAIAPGELDGDDGGDFQWYARVQPIAAQTVAPSGQPATVRTLYEIGVTESWGSGGRRHSVTLTTRRLGAALAEPQP